MAAQSSGAPPPLPVAPLIEPAVALATWDTAYAVHALLCALAAAFGAATFRLFAKEPFSLRTLGYVVASSAFGAFVAPPLGDRLAVSHISYLLLAAYVLGVAAPAIVPIIPALGVSIARAWARAWAAGLNLPDAAPYQPDKPPPKGPTDDARRP